MPPRVAIWPLGGTSLLLAIVSWAWAAQVQPPSGTPAPATAVPAYRQANKVAILTVQGGIDGITLRSLERRVRQARADGADAIVFDIDTPGGALDATLDICHLIRTEAPANTVAWINPQAYSAGTIIALACREIVVAPGSAFGDAAPISPFGAIPATERAKVESPLLTEVIDSARTNHYDEKLVESFIGVGVELWMLENIDTGERIFVDREEYGNVFDEDPPAQITPVAPPPGLQTQPPVRPWIQSIMPHEPAGAEPIDPEVIRQQIELEQSRPSPRAELTRADRDQWKLVKQVISNDRLLVVKPAQALEYGLAAATIANDDQLKAYFGAQTLERYPGNWSESLAQFLINPIVRGVLLVIFVICLLVELAAPGLGVFGATAGLSLLIVIGAPYLAGMAQWWEIMLILVGLGLIALELFIIPGFGVPGIGGAACVLVGLVGTFVSDDLSTQAGQSELLAGVTATFTALLASGIGAWLLFRQIETLPVLGRFILKAELGQTEGGGPGLLEAIGGGERPLEAGSVGMAETDLRPAGRADFDGRLVDVKSVGAYIDRGTRVRVVSVGRFAIEVEETE
ncbi:MAG: NfeD family protein [Planctomycetota bacterium]|jgi:membrane-bound ClpP family serine protease